MSDEDKVRQQIMDKVLVAIRTPKTIGRGVALVPLTIEHLAFNPTLKDTDRSVLLAILEELLRLGQVAQVSGGGFVPVYGSNLGALGSLASVSPRPRLSPEARGLVVFLGSAFGALIDLTGNVEIIRQAVCWWGDHPELLDELGHHKANAATVVARAIPDVERKPS